MKLAIIGLGLIGTSVALAARRASQTVEIHGIDRLEHARVASIFDRSSSNPADVHDSDIVILATPVADIVHLLSHVAPQLQACSLVIDTGSTKRAVLSAAQAAGLKNFVGGHPMAGAESSGAAAARADLFDGRPWFLVGSADTPAFREAQALVTKLGAEPICWSDDGTQHDQAMAAVSHLPQVVASALMARIGTVAGDSYLPLAGPGLHDTTRLAASAASMWESVLASNADLLRPLLKQLASDLEAVADRLDDPQAVRRLFSTANRWRQALESSADPKTKAPDRA